MIPNHPSVLLFASSCVYDEPEPYSLQISLQFLPDQYLVALFYTYMILTLLLYLPKCWPSATSGLENTPTLKPETQSHILHSLLERIHGNIPKTEGMGTLVYYKIYDRVEVQNPSSTHL